MSDGTVASRPEGRPAHVQVYGNDHSPWVQAVLLGLHEKGIAHTALLLPPLSVFLRSGVLMPAAKIDDGPWLLDSERILVELGFSALSPEERRAMGAVFASGAMRRIDQPWRFWHRFSFVRDGHSKLLRRCWNQFWRSFSIFYFFALIAYARRLRPRPSRERLAEEFALWQERLAPGCDFLGGDAPDSVDCQLFGQLQMCASIPGPSLAVLREDPKLGRLREWISAMQRHFAGYTHLYTARDFSPRLPEPERASALERACYWSGVALMWLAFPVTLATVFTLVRQVRKKGLLRS